MIPEGINDFLLASVGASASFIGLLFVALTLAQSSQTKNAVLAERERTLAGSSYTALITIFFISMAGLIPHSNVAWIIVALGWLGIGSSLRLVGRSNRGRDSTTTLSSLASLYLILVIFGLYCALFNSDRISLNGFYVIMFALYGVALARAWALSGVESEKVSKQ